MTTTTNLPAGLPPGGRPESDDCRPTCAARKFAHAECVCADLDSMGVPFGMTVREWFAPHNWDRRRAAAARAVRR